MNNKILLIVGFVLIAIGLLKPNFNIGFPIAPNRVSVSTPSDSELKEAAKEVTVLFVNKNGSKEEAVQLRDLYIGLSRLVALDGSDMVLKTTEEIRQANSLSGVMLHLDMKGKYDGLAKESNDVIVSAVGDDNVALTPDLRTKSSDAFMALAWAYDQAAN